MKKNDTHPQLVVMLTNNDYTTEDAEEIFEKCCNSPAKFWGMKEKPLPIERMKKLYSRMKDCGKTTFLEVVSYTEEEGLQGARIARDCGCDILMGTKFYDSIADFCHENGLKYMPFIGEITGRPSILHGEIEDIIAEAKEVVAKGADGIDLLGYRFEGDPVKLNKTLVEALDVPVCLAGSIDSFQRLDEVKEAAPWSFTIGSAFFDNKFPGDFPAQIKAVCDYMEQ